MAARYLVRIDDICPTMNWSAWEPVEELLRAADVRPLLAIVPDNQDPKLQIDPAADDFWERARGWQSSGWGIGLHGYQHRYVTHDSGLVGRNRYSEFAGVPRAEQLDKLQGGLEIFHRQGLRAEAWIAPAHSFDEATVELLKQVGVDCISDGYALSPYVCPLGLLWVPQQIGRFISLPFGTWTVCLHLNTWGSAEIGRFRDNISAFRDRIISLEQLRGANTSRRKNWCDGLLGTCFRTLRSLRA